MRRAGRATQHTKRRHPTRRKGAPRPAAALRRRQATSRRIPMLDATETLKGLVRPFAWLIDEAYWSKHLWSRRRDWARSPEEHAFSVGLPVGRSARGGVVDS